MNAIDIKELINIDPDDISDVLLKIEKSFGLDLKTDTFKNVRTFGELCDSISSMIELENADDCTTQQAFYKIRESIVNIQFLEKNAITPNSDLETLFPRKSRRHSIMQIQKESGRWFGKEFRIKTVGEASSLLARENYLKSRRNPNTVNRQEIVDKIRELFSYDLGLDPSVLTREAVLF